MADTPHYIVKQPNEKYVIAIDFSGPGDLPAGTNLSSGAVAAVDLTDGSTDNSVLGGVVTTIDTALKLAKVLIQAGTNGRKYRITFQTTLDDTDSSLLEDEVIMEVKDLL